jgi:hypothetical protein
MRQTLEHTPTVTLLFGFRGDVTNQRPGKWDVGNGKGTGTKLSVMQAGERSREGMPKQTIWRTVRNESEMSMSLSRNKTTGGMERREIVWP